jgi:asparagine synthetase B (glutamine-hydrolysing)
MIHGVFFNKNISLGQVRLSILDLTDKGHQPMFYSKENRCMLQKHLK